MKFLGCRINPVQKIPYKNLHKIPAAHPLAGGGVLVAVVGPSPGRGEGKMRSCQRREALDEAEHGGPVVRERFRLRAALDRRRRAHVAARHLAAQRAVPGLKDSIGERSDQSNFGHQN